MSAPHRIPAPGALAALVVPGLALALLWGPARPGAEASPLPGWPPAFPALEVLGTLEATLDGRASTWYVVAGPASDGPYASAVWLDLADGPVLTLGALDTDDPPLEEFSRGGAGAPPSLGSYEGSSFVLSFPIPPEGEGRYTVEEAGPGPAMAVYLPDATDPSLAATFQMVSGAIEVESGGVDGGEARARGTFSGTFRRGAEGETLEVTGGRFEVEDVPSVDAILPG